MELGSQLAILSSWPQRRTRFNNLLSLDAASTLKLLHPFADECSPETWADSIFSCNGDRAYQQQPMKTNYEPSQLAEWAASAAGNAAAAAEPSCGATPLMELGTYSQRVGNLVADESHLVRLPAGGKTT